jgi:cytochrome c-type biogenesis protein CcmH
MSPLRRPATALILLALLVGLPLLLTAFAPTAWSLSEREIEEKVLAISDQLRCPTCQGISVRDSEASFSKEIRAKVRRMVEEGQNEDQIRAYFVSRYGEWILRAPKKEGLGLVAWVLPGLAIIGLGLILGYRVYRNSRASEALSADAGAGGAATLTPDQQARVARDRKRFEEQD